MNILITGGAGFIGSAVIRYILNHTPDTVINVDKLTYAGNLASLAEVSNSPRYHFAQIDICNRVKLERLFSHYRPDAVMHLAAESHVDRSIDEPTTFIETNIIGTYTLLEVSRRYQNSLSDPQKSTFRFHHISTDEVYGDLAETEHLFTEKTPYAPSSPYSASKAAGDHLVRAWGRTYGLPILITNCSNNYGFYQYPEKLIPLMILNAIHGKPLPIYGNGLQIRDWLFVDDHVKALYLVLKKGRIGETYNIGGNTQKTNLEVVQTLCSILEEVAPNKPLGITQYRDLITHVTDRAGHDLHYAIDTTKIKRELHWQPTESFESGLRKTILWYLNNRSWWEKHDFTKI